MRPRRDAVVAAACAALALLALGPRAAGAQSGAVHGVVYDSLARRPLAGATVQLVRAEDLAGGRSVVADSAGAFRLDSLAPGRYLVGFAHPLLELLRVEPMPRLVELAPGGDVVRVDLGVPELARVRPVVCGSAQEAADSSGLLAGRVRDAADGAPVVNATVVLTWSEVAFGAGGVRTERRRLPVTTGPGGRYVVCGVPAGEDLVASAAAPGRASGEVAVEVPPLGLAVRDLALGDSAVVAEAAAATRPRAGDTTAAPIVRGAARLRGTVRDSAGRPVRGARVAVRGTAAEATVDDDGAFALAGLPSGTHTLEVRAIGYALRYVPVDLADGRAATAAVRLYRAPTLRPVTVFGKSSGLAGFYDRLLHNGAGRFITSEDLARMNLYDVSDALRALPGIYVHRYGGFRTMLYGRLTIPDGGRPGGGCPAVVLLDGRVLPPEADINVWVDPRQVAGIEVYPDGASAPTEYRVPSTRSAEHEPAMAGCSVIGFWTRRKP